MTDAPSEATHGSTVIALGGNALLARGDEPTAEKQRRRLADAARSIAEIAAHRHVVLTHGNGPQIGLLALEEAAYEQVPPYPLDILGAETQAMIGYLIEESLAQVLPGAPTVTVLTRVMVDAEDKAFAHPTKPIGPVYDEATAWKLSASERWTVAPDGAWWRRVVPSPEPLEIVELALIRKLVAAGSFVICAGGGGIPVVAEGPSLRGVEAVIDKDLTAALLAKQLDADALLILTDVNGVAESWHTEHERWIAQAPVEHLRGLQLPQGSMGPKVEACCRFVEETGRPATIASLADGAVALAGLAGTRVVLEGALIYREEREAGHRGPSLHAAVS